MKIIVSAGGTGGHIYPSLAIINKLKERNPDVEILYIGTTDRMEKDIIPSLGINYVGINIKGLNRRNIFKNFEVYKSYKEAIKKVEDVMKIFKPDVVVGVGGYVTLPVMKAALKLKIKTFIHEQNSIYGLTNKFLIKKVDVVGVSLLSSSIKLKNNVVLTGNPRSEEAFFALDIKKSKLGLSSKKKLVLIVMGSQGSLTITNIMKDTLTKFKDKDYEVLFITGKNYYDEYNNIDLPKNVKLLPNTPEMLSILKSTDLIVTRAGATTIAEITTLGVPSIIVPSPHVSNNHQEYNASLLEKRGASVVIKEKNLNKDNLVSTIDLLINNDKILSEMKKSNKDIGVKDSATVIAKIIENLAKGDKNGKSSKLRKRE